MNNVIYSTRFRSRLIFCMVRVANAAKMGCQLEDDDHWLAK